LAAVAVMCQAIWSGVVVDKGIEET
jgi:hypothetical protein